MTESLERLKESDWEVLLRRIREEKCTPVLGTGVYSETTNLRATIAEVDPKPPNSSGSLRRAISCGGG